MLSYISLVIFLLVSMLFHEVPVDAAHLSAGLSRTQSQAHPRSSSSQCEPFHSTYSASEISSSSGENTPFVAISPSNSYSAGSDGLQLFLEKPDGTIATKDGVNNKIASGATINSTFFLQYGKVTFTLFAPVVPGVVTAAILIAQDIDDEIDIELLGGDPSHWQSNIFAPNPMDTQPLWGVFGEIEDFASSGTIAQDHSYTVDWNAERIVWSVDGKIARTLEKDQTSKNGVLHFPTQPARIQLGIWDASAPAGTAQWAKGPIDWETAPAKMSATFKSITVECP